MNTVDLFFRFARGLVVVTLAAGVVMTSALSSAPAALAAPAAPAAHQKAGLAMPLPQARLELGKAPKAAPAAAAIRATDTCTTTYVVQRGDTLWRIGLKYGVEWPQIATKNSLANPDLIYAGQSLCVPAASSTPVTTTTPVSGTVLPSGTPTIEVVSVVADQSVTLRASNFPASRLVDVRMGKNGTLGVGGTLVTSVDAGTGVFTGTYTIPASLKGQSVIAIRLDSQWGGYYSYNWFFNSSTK